MNKTHLLLILLSIFIFISELAFAGNFNCPRVPGSIINYCGNGVNDPNCYPNGCNRFSGICKAPTGYTVDVYICDGYTNNCDYSHTTPISYSSIGPGIDVSVCSYAAKCRTVQLDIVRNAQGKDWLVWVADQQTNCEQCSYQSTQARFHTENHPTLEKYLVVNYGEQVKAVGVHNGEAKYWPDTRLRITGPYNYEIRCNSQCWFLPPYPGTYTLYVTTEGGSGTACEDTATLVVNPIITTTTIPSFGAIKIFKFYDTNANGIWEYGEDSLPGFEFQVSGPVNTRVITGSNGYVVLNNLPMGTYQVTEILPRGWVNTVPLTQFITINSPLLVEVRFGNKQIPIITTIPTTTTTTTTSTTTIITTNIDLGSLKISPSTICRDQDRILEISVPVTLVSGKDGTEITAKFYIEEDDGDFIFIGRERKTLDVGERKIFSIEYEYNAYDLSIGTHDVKVIVEDGDREIKYSSLKIKNCIDGKDIEIGFIHLNPEFPRSDDIVQGNVLISLKDAPELPQTVNVKVKIDNQIIATSNLKFYNIESKNYQFTFDASRYNKGSHIITVEAILSDISDISSRTFVIDGISGFITSPQHCLIIKDFWSDQPLKEEQSNTLKIRIKNCGLENEYSINAKLIAIGKTYYGSIPFLRPNEEKDISFTLRLDDLSILKATASIWNNHVSDEIEKEFFVLSGYPKVEVNPEYRVKQCSQNKINFDVINVGQLKDEFTINITGEPVKWFSGYPNIIMLDANKRTKITVDVNVPCDTKTGVYQFTISVQGSPKYSVTSSIVVVGEPFSFTGLFSGIEFNKWILWILGLLLVLILILLIISKSNKNKRRKSEKCMGQHGC